MTKQEKDPDTLNIIRGFFRLPPVELKRRKCLKCNLKFDSVGAHNRLCADCVRSNENINEEIW